MRTIALVPLLLIGCGTGALYPSRPPATPGAALADPSPSRVVIHATVSTLALKAALDEGIPRAGAGTFPLLGTTRKYIWQRVSLAVSYFQGRVVVQSQVAARVQMPIGEMIFPLNLKITAEPVVSAQYVAKLQSATVEVSSADSRMQMAQSVAGALDAIKEQVQQQIDEFSYDLRPLITEAHDRIARPIDLPLGGAHACAELRVLGVEAGPTVLADGVEKDLALVIAPSITLPCSAPSAPSPLPPLANVATLTPGPFTVEVPIAARYEELEKAMSLAFTGGKLFFSKDFPQVYLEKPEVYAAADQLIVKLHLAGPISKPIHMVLDGDLYMSGHPQVIDNELRVPDLQPTIDTSSFLLRLKASLDADSIRDQARAALHLDIGERMRSVREKLSSELSFGSEQGCLRADVNKIVVTGVHAHPTYIRLYVALTGQAAVYLPCPQAPPPTPAVTNRM